MSPSPSIITEKPDGFIVAPTPSELDIVSDVKFSPIKDQFLVSSWDNRLTLYDATFVDSPQQVMSMKCDTTVLSIAHHGSSAYVGCIDGTVRSVDYENSKLVPEFAVSDGIDCGVSTVHSIDNLLVCTTFDKHVLVYDARQRREVARRKTQNKMLCIDSAANKVTLGMSQRAIEIYDVRNFTTPIQVRESGLKSQTSDLKCFPDGTGFAVASIDGRVSIEYFDPSARVQEKKYAFKCHRHFNSLTGSDAVYPVNSLGFNRATDELYTCGSDGFVSVWNWQKKRRVKQFDRFEVDGTPMSVVKLDINRSGSKLVCATSDDSYKSQRRMSYDGSLPREPSQIYVHSLA